MRTGRSSARARRGSTLITVTILLGTMTVLAMIFLRVGQRVSVEQVSSLETARATLLAEAGVSEACEAIRAGQSGNLARAEDPAYLGGGVVWVEATDLGKGLTQLDSMAMKDGGRAALRVVVDDGTGGNDGGGDGVPGDGFQGMLFSNQHLQLDQEISIDSYDSTLGPYALQATNLKDGVLYAGTEGSVAGNSTIQMDSDAHLFGDVYSGPGTSPDLASDAYVSGTAGSIAKPVTLAPVVAPALPDDGTFSVGNNQTKTIAPGTYHYTSVTQGKFSKLKIVGPATLVWDGYTAGNAATLELDCTDGPITIYDTGVWSVDKNYTVGPSLGSPLDAAFLMSSTDTVQFDQGSKIQVGFYAPSATIQVDQGAEVWGALVADQLDIKQGTEFHFDVNLKGFPLPWDVPDFSAAVLDPEPEVVSWSRIEFPLREFALDRRDPMALLGVEKSDLRPPAKAWEQPDPGTGP